MDLVSHFIEESETLNFITIHNNANYVQKRETSSVATLRMFRNKIIRLEPRYLKCSQFVSQKSLIKLNCCRFVSRKYVGVTLHSNNKSFITGHSYPSYLEVRLHLRSLKMLHIYLQNIYWFANQTRDSGDVPRTSGNTK